MEFGDGAPEIFASKVHAVASSVLCNVVVDGFDELASIVLGGNREVAMLEAPTSAAGINTRPRAPASPNALPAAICSRGSPIARSCGRVPCSRSPAKAEKLSNTIREFEVGKTWLGECGPNRMARTRHFPGFTTLCRAIAKICRIRRRRILKKSFVVLSITPGREAYVTMGYMSEKQLRADYLEIVRKNRERRHPDYERAEKRNKVTRGVLIALLVLFLWYLTAHHG